MLKPNALLFPLIAFASLGLVAASCASEKNPPEAHVNEGQTAATDYVVAPRGPEDIFTDDIICYLWPTAPSCPRACPPFCLDTLPEDFRVAKDLLLPRLSRTSVRFKASADQLVLSNGDGNAVSLRYEVGPTTNGQTTISYSASFGGAVYSWKVVHSAQRDSMTPVGGADVFKRLVSGASPRYNADLRKLFVAQDSGSPTNPQLDFGTHQGTQDDVFCGVLGILTGSANPIAGAGIYAMCEWFASNGLD
jgi:hypothetical protein